MNDAYRQKLLNWFCSIGLVLLAMIVSATHGWFFKFPDRAFSAVTFDTADLAVAFGTAMNLYPLFAPPLMFWHFFDFVEKANPNSAWGRKTTRYRAIFLVSTSSLVLFVLMGSGLWEYNSCDQLKGVYFFQCYTRTSYWLMIPWLATLGLAVLLCIVKAGFSIRSYFEKSQ